MAEKDILERGIATASALLTREEYGRFLSDFNELEIKRQSIVIATDEGDKLRVNIITNEVSGFLLRASFKDGLLNHWKWSEKFQVD